MTERLAGSGLVPMNQRVSAMLAETDLTRLPLQLSPDTVERLGVEAEALGWTFDQLLEAAFLRGVLGLEREQAVVPLDRMDALRRAQEAGGLYAALKYQLGKLEKSVFVEETRLAGASSITSTFEDLIGRLRERLDAP
ncbi:MAG: hypothetical protein M3Z66_17420 [Chloroflexota bacterium]|nr:hypothetical protein [Chloroflexota bacterium]